MVYSLDKIVSPGETVMSHKFETFPGGKGFNQSIAAARAGANVFYAGCLGCDDDYIIDILSKNNIDTSYIKRVDQKSGHAIIQVESSGQNSIFVFSGANEMVTTDYIDTVLQNFDRGDIILLQNEISNVDYIIDKGYVHCVQSLALQRKAQEHRLQQNFIYASQRS